MRWGDGEEGLLPGSALVLQSRPLLPPAVTDVWAGRRSCITWSLNADFAQCSAVLSYLAALPMQFLDLLVDLQPLAVDPVCSIASSMRPLLGAPQSIWGCLDKHFTACGSPGWLRELNSGPLHSTHGAPDLALMQVFTVSGARSSLCHRFLASNTPPAPRTRTSAGKSGDTHPTVHLGPEEMLLSFSASFLARTSPISHPPLG